MNATHSFSRQAWAGLGLVGLFWLALGLAQAATTLSITPSGTLATVANVPVTVSLAGAAGKDLESFEVRLNNADITATFLGAAQVSQPAPGEGSLRVEYLFGPGTYSFSSRIKFAGEAAVSASTTFTVPGDLQEQRVNTVLSQVQQYVHQWDSYDFSQWVKLGDMAVFRARAYEPAFQVYVDPGYLASGGSAAEYVEKYIWKYIWTVYDQDLVIADEPENVSQQTLWHEMIHAVSHGAQVRGAANALTGDDHVYIGWAEGCALNLGKLRNFEMRVNQYGKSLPTATQAADARGWWKRFVEESAKSTYAELGPISAAQKAALESLIGFRCDVDEIRAGYLALGYSPSYFYDVSVAITSPASGTETPQNQVEVEAVVTNQEPGLSIQQAALVVNGAVQLAPLSGNSFGGTAVLRTGDNTLHAAVQASNGAIFVSPPVALNSTALNNRYHIRITWDKNDTDVDLHFAWSGGATCYYGNRSPNWGSPSTSPRLDVDDTDGYGPENITIDSLPGPGTYRMYVHYFSDHGKGGTTVNATIYENGVAIFSNSRYMSDRETWDLLNFSL